MGTIVDQMVDAGADAVIGAVDGALDRIPGFDAITSAVNRGISQTSGRQFLQDFAEDVEFVPSGSGGWTLSSTASSAAKVISKLAQMGGLMLAGSVATQYLNDLVPTGPAPPR